MIRFVRTAAAIGLLLVSAAPTTAHAQTDPPTPEPPLRRWLAVDFAQLSTRYRVIENSAQVTTANQLQYRGQFRVHAKFDRRERYTVHAGLFSGSAFTSSWNTTGLGTGSPVTNFRLKQLYAAAAPLAGIEGQLGGLYVLRGENSEITSYDEDGFLMGERLQVSRPQQLFFDEVAFTNARLGETTQPSVFHRFDELDDPNYRQLLVRKRISKQLAASTDLTTLSGAWTIRAGMAWTHPAVALRLEAYRRVRLQTAGGFAVSAERRLHRMVRASAGYATIDPLYGGLNGDRFDRGRRVFGIATVALFPWLTVTTYATHAFKNDFSVPIQNRFDVVLTYNLLDTLRRSGFF